MLRTLPREARLVISIFFVLCALGPFVNASYHALKVGIGIESAADYYQGDGDVPQKSLLEVVETAHFHIWIQTVVFFLAAFIFSLSGRPSSHWKTFLIVMGFGSSFLHIVSPLVARMAPRVTVSLVLAGAVGTTLSLWMYAYFVLGDLWGSGPRRSDR